MHMLELTWHVFLALHGYISDLKSVFKYGRNCLYLETFKH